MIGGSIHTKTILYIIYHTMVHKSSSGENIHNSKGKKQVSRKALRAFISFWSETASKSGWYQFNGWIYRKVGAWEVKRTELIVPLFATAE